MPDLDDFDTFDDDIVDTSVDDDAPVTVAELEAARQVLARSEAGQRLAEATVTAVNRVERRKKNRGKKPARPAGAPEPQDHLPKRDPRAAEAANGSTYVLTLWDETVEIDQADLIDSWDFQLGTVQNNPLMMVKGLLGDKFAWFTVRARADGKTPLEAANEVMQMFARATGFDSTGK